MLCPEGSKAAQTFIQYNSKAPGGDTGERAGDRFGNGTDLHVHAREVLHRELLRLARRGIAVRLPLRAHQDHADLLTGVMITADPRAGRARPPCS